MTYIVSTRLHTVHTEYWHHWCHLGDELCCQQFLVSNILLLADQFIQKILPNWQSGRLAPAPAQPRSCIWNKKLSNYETRRQCRGHCDTRPQDSPPPWPYNIINLVSVATGNYRAYQQLINPINEEDVCRVLGAGWAGDQCPATRMC